MLYPWILVPRFSWPMVDVSSGQGWYEWLIMHWLLIGVSQVPAEASLSPEESRPAPAIRILVRLGGHWRRITGDPPFLPTCGNFVQMVLHFLGKCMLINRLRLIYFYGTCCLLSTAQLTSYFLHRFASEENDKINMMEGRLEWLGWWSRDRFL